VGLSAPPGSLTNTEPFARLARHRHVATHHARKLAREGKAEPGAAEALRGRGIGLAEFLERVGRAGLEAALRQAPDGILRAKGFVSLADGGAHVVQIVGRWSLTPAPNATAVDGAWPLMVIGRTDARTARRVEVWLARCGARPYGAAREAQIFGQRTA
jgi:hypothetical protein